MKDPFSPTLPSKKEYVYSIGLSLINSYGKQAFYTPEQVEQAHRKSKWYKEIGTSDLVEYGAEYAIDYGADICHWAISTFSSHEEFDRYMAEVGKAYDYVEMRTEMLQDFTSAESLATIDFSGFNMESSWIYFGEVFGDVIEGVGEFFGYILEGVLGIFQ